MSIMSSAILRWVLAKISSFFENSIGKYLPGENHSLSMKLLQYQRLILITGIKCQSTKNESAGLSQTCGKIVSSLQRVMKRSDYRKSSNNTMATDYIA